MTKRSAHSRFTYWIRALGCLAIGGALTGVHGLRAQEAPRIRDGSVQVRPDGQVGFQFELSTGDVRDFQVESTLSIGAGMSWSVESQAVITESVPGLFAVTVPVPVGIGASFYRVRMDPSVLPALVINEVMSNNDSAFADASKAFHDWIELHNPTETAVNLAGFGLTDDPEQPLQWVFPETLLQPDAYLVVFASGLDRREPGQELHANFKLNSGGDRVLLTSPDKRVVDDVVLTSLGSNESVGRVPGAEESWAVYTKANVTPGKANGAVSSGPPIPAPEFSATEQFQPVGGTATVELKTGMAGATIRYTTNGAAVGTTAAVYSGPITLKSTAVVRARVYVGARSSAENFRTYFFGVSHSLPILSMATSPTNMDFKNGFLYGMNSTVVTTSGTVLQSYPYSGSNAWKDREVEASFEMFETNQAPVVRQRLGVKVFGGWGSRGYPQKSLALFAREKYGEGKISHAIFPDKSAKSYENLVLRNSGNDNQSTHQTAVRPPITQFGPTVTYGSYFVNGTFTLMRDAMMERLVEDLDLDTQAYRPSVVYINGDYWGIYNIREKINENYVRLNHDLPKGQVDVIEGYGSVMAGDATVYNAMRTFIGGRDMKVATNYATVADKYLDIDNFIDYHLTVIYNQNFDIGNIKCWRPRTPTGRFRWVAYDQDYGFGLWPAAIYVPAMARDYGDYDNMFKFYTASSGSGTGWPNEGGRTLLLRRMLLNDGFKARFITRCADLLNSVWREERVVETIDTMASVIRPEIPAHLKRWSWVEQQARGNGKPYQAEYAPFVQDTWEKNIEVLRDFGRKRPAKLRLDCAQHFGLANGTAKLDLNIQPSGAGRVLVNTLVVTNFPWNGVLFRDYPVQLTAIPKPGFRFKGTTPNATTPTSASWQLTLPAGTTSATAYFEPIPVEFPNQPKVHVSEFQYHPATNQLSGDWIELHNPGVDTVVTTGWILRDESDDREFLLPNSTLLPGGYLVVSQDKAAFTVAYPSVNRVVGSFPFGLGNGGDTIRVYDSVGNPVVRLDYDDVLPWTPDADGTGRTLQLIQGTVFSKDPAAWKASPQIGGSPGLVNP